WTVARRDGKETLDRLTAGRLKVCPLDTKFRRNRDAMLGQTTLESCGARHRFVEDPRACDMRDSTMTFLREVSAHAVGPALAIHPDVVNNGVSQIADHHRRHVELAQSFMRVGHSMERDVADDQTVDALMADLTQIVARVRLRATARNVRVEHQH